MKHVLRIRCQNSAERTVELPANGSVSLGRCPPNGVPVEDEQVSRVHCEFRSGPSGITLRDMGSRNGTYVNEVRIADPVIVNPGDAIHIGSTSLAVTRLREPGDPELEPQDPSGHVCLSCGRIGPAPCPKCGLQYLMPLNGLSNLTIEKRLGAGGMGVVLLARKAPGNAPVALKVMAFSGEPPEEDLKRFMREAKIPEAMDHENVARVLGSGGIRIRSAAGIDSGKEVCKAAYILMEFVEGRDLVQLVKEEGPLPVQEAVRIGCSVADVLTRAAEQGIVHRDIKPQNVMVTRAGVVKVMDFGLAKSFETAGLSGVTAAGKTLGTPSFMSPEQVKDARSADHRADIYSLGATLFFILTGKTPFYSKKLLETLEKVLKEPAPKLADFRPDAPPALAKIISKCMEKDPKRRYPTAVHLWEELTKLLEDSK